MSSTSPALPANAPAPLTANLPLLDAAELALARMLLACGQAHLFSEWAPPGEADDAKHSFFDQVAALDEAYPGGLSSYIGRARKLLAASKAGDNPLEGWTPAVPASDVCTALEPGTDAFYAREERGLEAAVGLGFVVAAGGLGERLGFSGIKLALPCEIATGITVLGLYCAHIASLQNLLTSRLGRTVVLPLAIMTSDDTHAATLKMLESNKYYGLLSSQVTCVQQGRVAALRDSGGALAVSKDSPYSVQTKPHGHGDVHALMHSTGLATKWERQGVHWLYLLQDSSALYFSHYVASLGVAVEDGLDCAFVATPRRPKMALGLLAGMVKSKGSSKGAKGAADWVCVEGQIRRVLWGTP